MKTMKRWACLKHAWASGTKRRGAARLGYGIAWAGLALLTATLSAAPGPLIFKPAAGSPVGAGTSPESVGIGDVNGDGRPDLALPNSFPDGVSVLLGKGDGTFQPAVNFHAGDGADSVALGDVNGDGRPDLAVADSNRDNGSVLLNTGGTPAPAVTCNGRPATIVGNNKANTIFGTPGNDVIHGRGGNDIIRGLGGNDVICGGAGKDKLFGGIGKDALDGGGRAPTSVMEATAPTRPYAANTK